MQIADKVSKGSGADGSGQKGQVLQGSGWLIMFGGSRCRWPMKFRMVPVQIADKAAELSGAHSRQSSGRLRYKNLPRSSKLLGITREFIWKLPPPPCAVHLSHTAHTHVAHIHTRTLPIHRSIAQIHMKPLAKTQQSQKNITDTDILCVRTSRTRARAA